jgi:hypothetical protein
MMPLTVRGTGAFRSGTGLVRKLNLFFVVSRPLSYSWYSGNLSDSGMNLLRFPESDRFLYPLNGNRCI